MIENPIVSQLRGIAAKLTGDTDLQKNLMQEMFVHLIHVETAEPGRTLSWYLKSCEVHARRCLKLGDDVGAPAGGISLSGDEHRTDGAFSSQTISQIEIQGELITSDVLSLILPLLSDMQQRVLFLLMKGCGIREAGRELGISHPAVIKHRKKIARIARELLQGSEGVGVATAIHHSAEASGNGNGGAHTA